MYRLILLIFILFSLNIHAQETINYKKPEVGIVEIFRKGFSLSFPAIELYSDDRLELRFDVFGNNRNTLYYKINLYDYNWLPVEINESDYIEGFFENNIDPYSGSINSTLDYVQYRLIIPNENIKILSSGNYIIKIFKDEDMQDTLLFRRFVVYDELVPTTINLDKFQSQIHETNQELFVNLSTSEATINYNSGELQLCILQNNDWFTAQYIKNYSTNSKGELTFNLPGQIVFNGRNEFRFFDMKSLKFISERVKYVDYEPPYYHIYLKPDNLRGDKEYFFKEDLNGMFFIDNTDTEVEEILDADYGYVHFTLETGYPFPADIFICGALTDWSYSENFMEYNPETGNYEGKLLLKQGLYNYRYEMREFDTKKLYTDITEGDHYQTNNNYLAFIYFKALGDLYFKPVGINVLSTKF